ncbi:MAG: L,D-transpeptidase [Woeseiaceae bacterium]
MTDLVKTIEVNISTQTLSLFEDTQLIKTYAVSTAKNGTGQLNGSECTPLGKHSIHEKLGEKAAENSVFVGRSETGEIFTESLRQAQPERDWILSRILWLSGLELGKNRGGEVDTMRRYIYIHGCPDADSFSVPSSHGCVKMRNKDVIDLFKRVTVGAVVEIKNGIN